MLTQAVTSYGHSASHAYDVTSKTLLSLILASPNHTTHYHAIPHFAAQKM